MSDRSTRRLLTILSSTVFLLTGVGVSLAQQSTGTPGSPSATTTIDGKQLPPPPPKFGGVIKESAKDRSPGGRRASCRRRARPTCC